MALLRLTLLLGGHFGLLFVLLAALCFYSVTYHHRSNFALSFSNSSVPRHSLICDTGTFHMPSFDCPKLRSVFPLERLLWNLALPLEKFDSRLRILFFFAIKFYLRFLTATSFQTSNIAIFWLCRFSLSLVLTFFKHMFMISPNHLSGSGNTLRYPP